MTNFSTRERRSDLGQFLTPEPLAGFMASMFGPLPSEVRLLDAGAGTGSLTEAFITRCCREPLAVRSIKATLYELDHAVLSDLLATLERCRHLCRGAGIDFTYFIRPTDFIQETSAQFGGDLFAPPPPAFNVAIVNPPYRKIATDSKERHALRFAGIETSNLYTGFIALIQRLLIPGGQIVSITPRSFCNGPYFRSFRFEFLAQLALRRIHIFESREAAFRSDGVLQENIIFHAVKSASQPPGVLVSSSSGEHNGCIDEAIVPFSEIVYSKDPEKFIHIPSKVGHAVAREALDGLPADLASLGVTVSTGRVVDFRLKDALRMQPENGTVPLLHPSHMVNGIIRWPKADYRKPSSILDNENTRPWLVPSGVYLLTKRFTSKEERRRLVACLFDPNEVEAEWLGFENHLNYFHTNGGGLERYLAMGLYVFLNSTVVDQYFRCFSGHTQVNATDLRALHYPLGDTLRAMGREMRMPVVSQVEIDQLLAKHLHGHQ